jgi:D-arabinose 1-dehydrogenase-like Zn-dependent alcohol dehydrogenase
MQAVVVSEQSGPWALHEVAVPEIGAGQVLVKVHASRICGTDSG